MIIDLILDLYDNIKGGYFWGYSPTNFFENVREYEQDFDDVKIYKAFKTNNNVLIQKALCEYINNEEYNILICDFINGFDWTKEQNCLTFAYDKVKENINALIEWNFSNGDLDLSCKLAKVLQQFENIGG